jgi:hypothetical protein
MRRLGIHHEWFGENWFIINTCLYSIRLYLSKALSVADRTTLLNEAAHFRVPGIV